MHRQPQRRRGIELLSAGGSGPHGGVAVSVMLQVTLVFTPYNIQAQTYTSN